MSKCDIIVLPRYLTDLQTAVSRFPPTDFAGRARLVWGADLDIRSPMMCILYPVDTHILRPSLYAHQHRDR